MFYHVGDSQHTQYIQINKAIGENEKCVFYFMKNTKQLFGQPNISHFCLSILDYTSSNLRPSIPSLSLDIYRAIYCSGF